MRCRVRRCDVDGCAELAEWSAEGFALCGEHADRWCEEGEGCMPEPISLEGDDER